jgi:hypothetical protein
MDPNRRAHKDASGRKNTRRTQNDVRLRAKDNKSAVLKLNKG